MCLLVLSCVRFCVFFCVPSMAVRCPVLSSCALVSPLLVRAWCSPCVDLLSFFFVQCVAFCVVFVIALTVCECLSLLFVCLCLYVRMSPSFALVCPIVLLFVCACVVLSLLCMVVFFVFCCL